MVRDACLVILTAAMIGWMGYMIACDVRQRRELADFQERLTARLAGARWEAYPLAPEVEG